MTGMGHEERLPPLWLNARCVIRQGTFVGTNGNARDAPFPAIRGTAMEPRDSTPDQPFLTAPAGGRVVWQAEIRGSAEPNHAITIDLPRFQSVRNAPAEAVCQSAIADSRQLVEQRLRLF